MRNPKNPQVFIASSTEAKKIRNAIVAELQSENVHAHPWDTVIKPSEFLIDGLDRVSNICDAAILVFAPDDNIESRGDKYKITRDNVIFEAGYFMAKFGANRTFFIMPNDNSIKPISDLEGINVGHYDPFNENRRSAVRPFCMEVIEVVNKIFEEQRLSFSLIQGKTELSHVYTIQVLNKRGDATVTKNTTLEITSTPIRARNHEIYSDSSTQQYEELCLEAWDENNLPLKIIKEQDFFSRKEFIVDFGRFIDEGERFNYSYRYHWNKLFPINETYFVVKNNFNSIKFQLILPNTLPLANLTVSENRQLIGGRKRRKKLKIPGIERDGLAGLYTEHKIELENIDESIGQIRFDWAYEI